VSWRTVTAEKLEIEQLASLWTPGQSVTPIGNLLQQLVVDKKEGLQPSLKPGDEGLRVERES